MNARYLFITYKTTTKTYFKSKKKFSYEKNKTKVEKINFLAMPFRVFTLVCGFGLTTNYEFRLFDSFPNFFQKNLLPRIGQGNKVENINVKMFFVWVHN
jgi:hypothetical protein